MASIAKAHSVGLGHELELSEADAAQLTTTLSERDHAFAPVKAGGPELDVAVPAIDRGAELPAGCGIAPIIGCRERAALFAEALAQDGRQ